MKKILKRVEPIYYKATLVGKMTEIIENTWYESLAPLHHVYFSFFNLIDIGDGYFYACDESHPNHFWKSKMLQSIMWLGVINMEYLFRPYCNFTEFFQDLPNWLVVSG